MPAYQNLTFAQKWLSLFLFLPFLVGVFQVVGLYAGGIDMVQQIVRSFFYRPDEVIHQAIENAFSGQELLLKFDESLREFDKTAKATFGVNHQWPKTDTEAHPPKHIRAWLRSYPPSREEELLIQYSRLVDSRQHFYELWETLAKDLQSSVSQMPSSARPDLIMKTEITLRVDLTRAIEDFAWQQKALEELAVEYTKKGKSL